MIASDLGISEFKFIEIEWHIEMRLILMERATEKYFTGRVRSETTSTLPTRSAVV
jgi:hypothetical protein